MDAQTILGGAHLARIIDPVHLSCGAPDIRGRASLVCLVISSAFADCGHVAGDWMRLSRRYPRRAAHTMLPSP